VPRKAVLPDLHTTRYSFPAYRACARPVPDVAVRMGGVLLDFRPSLNNCGK